MLKRCFEQPAMAVDLIRLVGSESYAQSGIWLSRCRCSSDDTTFASADAGRVTCTRPSTSIGKYDPRRAPPSARDIASETCNDVNQAFLEQAWTC